MFSITYRIMRGRIHIHYRKKANRPINQLLRDKKKKCIMYQVTICRRADLSFTLAAGWTRVFWVCIFARRDEFHAVNRKKRRMCKKKGMCETSCSFNLFIGSLTALGDKSFNINLHASKPICCCLNMLVLNFISRILNEVL